MAEFDLLAKAIDGAVIVEMDDFIEFDISSGSAKIDKHIFDVFMKDCYMEIYCPDIDPDIVMQFKMIAEDDEGICMEWIDSVWIGV